MQLVVKCRRSAVALVTELRKRWRWLLLAYAICEALAFRRFALRLQRLHVPRKRGRRGTIMDLEWVLQSVRHSVCPLSFSKQSIQRYLDEKSKESCSVSWEHYYAMIREAMCMASPAADEHRLLLQIANSMALKQGLTASPANARPPNCEAPVAYGASPILAFYKPLPLEFAMQTFRRLIDVVFLVLGYKKCWLPTPEGWLRFWIAEASCPDPKMLPAVFIHGVGLGAAPYILFLEQLRRKRNTTLVVVELPNCSRSHYQSMMPSAASFRDVMERMLQQQLGITEPARYVLLGHSLGTDFCSMIMNDPRLAEDDTILRPARVVLLDAICFGHEVAAAHRLPFWTLREAVENHKGPLALLPFALAILFLVIRDEHNQEATKRAVVPGTDVIFRCSPALLRRCPTLVCLSGNDQALPAWEIRDYVRVHFPEIEVRMDPGFEHGGFLMPWLPSWQSRCYVQTVLGFLESDVSCLPRAASHMAKDATHMSAELRGRKTPDDEGPPLRQKSRSELTLAAARVS